MASQNEVEYVLKHLQESHLSDFFKTLSEGNAGIGAVLHVLYDTPHDITAGNISDYMHVSTARVAVLLRKMSEKGFIVKDTDANDARIKVVHLSPTGQEKVRRMRENIYSQIGVVIDKVGMDRMREFIAISDDIKNALSSPEMDF